MTYDREIIKMPVATVAAANRGQFPPEPKKIVLSPTSQNEAVTWRYTIPGQGVTRWGEVFRILGVAGYKGVVSIELEDENFYGSEANEQSGLIHSLAFLSGA